MSQPPNPTNPPTTLFAWPGGTAVYVLPSPTPSQLALFRTANIDLPRQSHCIPNIDLMRRAGATLHADMNACPEAMALLRSRTAPERRDGAQVPQQPGTPHREGSLLAWPSSGGVWVLSNPSAAQWELVEREGQSAGREGQAEDGYARALQKAGATFFAEPADNETAREALLA